MRFLKLKKVKVKINTFLILIAIASLILSCQKGEKNNLNKHSFEEGLKMHLDAIQNRSFKELEPTIADDVSLIYPDGTSMDSKEKFLEFHKDWFKLKNWQWQGNILKTESSDSLGYGLVQYRYTENDSTGNTVYESNAYLILVFRNSKDGWQLVHDQNTKILD